MIRKSLLVLAVLVCALVPAIALPQPALVRVLAFYSTNVERDHVDFAEQALTFFAEAAKRDNFQFESTTNWDDLNPERLKGVQVLLWFNDSAHTATQRAAFEQYM